METYEEHVFTFSILCFILCVFSSSVGRFRRKYEAAFTENSRERKTSDVQVLHSLERLTCHFHLKFIYFALISDL